MATVGSAFESASYLGQQGTVGAYAFSETNVRFRFQKAGTAGTFVSEDSLAQELGVFIVEELRKGAIIGLQKTTPLAKVQQIKGAGQIFPKGAVGGNVTVTGQWSQAVLSLSRAEHFLKYGAFVIDEEWETKARLRILEKMADQAELLADKIILEKVYDVPAKTVDLPSEGNNPWGKSGKKEFYGAYERTDTLLNAFEVTPFASGFSIGFNEDMLKSESGSHGGVGVNYALFVEHGHQVTIFGKKIPRMVEGRPFMNEVMEAIRRMIDKAFIYARSQRFEKILGDTVFAWITNTGLGAGVVGGRI